MSQISTFLSYDYKHDLKIKNGLIEQWSRPECPIKVKDDSLNESIPEGDPRWQSVVGPKIKNASVVLVVCGPTTHSADGVKIETQMAMKAGKQIIYLRAYQTGSSLPAGVSPKQEMIPTDWQSIVAELRRRGMPM